MYRGMMQKFRNCGIQLPENAKILEVGSGHGDFLEFLKKKGLDVEGVDMNPKGEGITKAKIEKLPYKDESFDCVISKHVFDGREYFQSPRNQQAMWREIARVLKASGVYYAEEIIFEPIDGFELVPDPRDWRAASVYKKLPMNVA